MVRVMVWLTMVGCVVHTQGEGRSEPEPAGDGPEITFADAEFRTSYVDEYWRFEADVEEGDDDIDAVIMDVYDEGCGRCRVESIELFEAWTGHYEHDWYGSLDVLDPSYDRYVIEVVAYDAAGRLDVKEIWPH